MNKTILICTPAYNFQCYVHYISTILKLDRICRQHGMQVHYLFRNDSLITIARNIMSNIFLETGYDYLLFIDSDMEIDPNYIYKMILEDKPIIGLICAKKLINWENITKNIKEYRKNKKLITINDIKSFGRELNITFNNTLNINDSIIKVDNIGTGVMLIKKETFEEMKKISTKFNYEGKEYYKFFDSDIINDVYLSEDYWFCQQWKKLGGNIYALNNIHCLHHGVYKY